MVEKDEKNKIGGIIYRNYVDEVNFRQNQENIASEAENPNTQRITDASKEALLKKQKETWRNYIWHR
jgi:predicted DNA binding CopG/RHH family protein